MATYARKIGHLVSAHTLAWLERRPRLAVIIGLALMAWMAVAMVVTGLFETWTFVSRVVLGP